MSAKEFIQTSGVNFMHQLPRFGHGSDFSQLFSTNQDEQVDYVVGLWAVSFFILAAFLMWASVIITFACMGKARVGFLAGRVRVTSDAHGDFYIPRHLSKLRILFIVLGVGVILCNVAIIGPGLSAVEDATLSTRKLTRDVDDLATQGLLIMDGVSNAEHNINELNVEALLRLEDACPSLQGNPFVNDKQLKSSVATLEKAFNNLEEYVDGSEFEDIRESIDMIMDGTSTVNALVTEVEMNDWILKMFVLFLDVLVTFMILSTLVSLSGNHLEPLKFITMMLVFPAFVVLICASWVAAAFISFLGISNADFCAGPEGSGADATVSNIMKSFIPAGSLIFTALTYIQSGCATQDPIRHFYKYEDYIQTGMASAQIFLVKAEEIGIDEISTKCGAPVRSIIENIGLVKDNFGILLSALRSTFDLASCSKLRPIYTHAFEGTTCTDSAGGLIMMFALLLGVGVIGMFMIMFRAAMYPCKLVFSKEAVQQQPYDDQDEWEEYQAYLRYMTDFLSYWGRHEEDPSIQKNDSGTKSDSSSSEEEIDEGIPDMVTCEPSSSWEGRSFPPSCNPDYESVLNPRSQDDFANIELDPLSPKAHNVSAQMPGTPGYPVQFVPPPNNPNDDTMDECQPLSPDTPKVQSIKSSSSHGRLRTPDFLSPGTFRRWRRHDIDELATAPAGMPESPLMVSPKEHGGTSYFSKALNMTNFISPLTKKVHSPKVENSAKTKYF